jgi:rhomboid protease GluP
MGAIVITAVGETRDDAELRRAYRELCDSGALGRQLPESIWALIAAAAYLGDVDGVREHTGEHRADAPPERLAFFVATAEQRAGHPERARGTIEAALARARSGHSARSRLQYRLDHPLEPAPQGEPFDALRADVSRRLDALRTLAPLRVSMRRPAPLTLGVAVSLALAFFWQLSQPTMDASFTRLGLVSPFDRAPDLHRLLSYGWLHLDSGHLLMNLVGLALFGRFVERHFEMARFVVIYLAGVLAGGAAYLAWERQTLGVAIGASGAVLALFGATVARIGLDRGVRASPQGRRELAFLATIAALQLIIDAFWAQSSGSAHAGGLAAGLLLGALLRPRRRG